MQLLTRVPVSSLGYKLQEIRIIYVLLFQFQRSIVICDKNVKLLNICCYTGPDSLLLIVKNGAVQYRDKYDTKS